MPLSPISALYQLRQQNHARHLANRSLCNTIHSENNTPTIYLYDVIDSDPHWGFAPTQLAEMLNGIDAEKIHLRIDSPGGDVFAARTMFTLLSQHPAQIHAHIDGLAASAATYLSTAADHITMVDGGFYMIHNAWTVAAGDGNAFEKMASELRKIDGSIAKDYQRMTDLETEQIHAWMNEETWFDASEAKTHGFIHDIYTVDKKTNTKNQWDLSAFKHSALVSAKITPESSKTEPENTEKTLKKPVNTVPEKYKRHAELIHKNI